MTRAMDEQGLLMLWQHCVGADRCRRDELLLGDEQALGARATRALALRAEWFGPRLELLADCPHCSATVEFALDAHRLAAELQRDASSADGGGWHEVERLAGATRLRPPCWRDVAEASARAQAHGEDFALVLLARCSDADVAALAPDARDALAARVAALDPGARVTVALGCPDCGCGWNAPLDAADLLWRELRRRAESLLSDVAALAEAWGWRESDVFALHPVRRAAYLQLAGARSALA
jgi:hypothetical protein